MIKFDLSTLLVFLSGLLIGFLIFVLIYLYAVLKSLSRKVKIKNVEEEDIDEQEIRWLIIDAQKTFNDKNIRNNEGYGALLLRLIKELTNDIASKFYPNSRNPYLELTIDETIILANYISVRFDELMSRRILKLFRGMTVNQLLFVKTTKDSIEGHKIVKQLRKHRVTSILKGALATINLANPLYWVRKSFNKISNVVLVKIGIAIIGITGEETYKIYSKKVFNEEKELDTGLDDLYESIRRDVDEED